MRTLTVIRYRDMPQTARNAAWRHFLLSSARIANAAVIMFRSSLTRQRLHINTAAVVQRPANMRSRAQAMIGVANITSCTGKAIAC
jgi:hypothetical protein